MFDSISLPFIVLSLADVVFQKYPIKTQRTEDFSFPFADSTRCPHPRSIEAFCPWSVKAKRPSIVSPIHTEIHPSTPKSPYHKVRYLSRIVMGPGKMSGLAQMEAFFIVISPLWRFRGPFIRRWPTTGTLFNREDMWSCINVTGRNLPPHLWALSLCSDLSLALNRDRNSWLALEIRYEFH